MELLSAQNEAQAARQETRKVRAELAEAQNQRSRAERQSKELQNLNRLLRTELTQSTQSFRQAMQTAQRFLIEGQAPLLAQGGLRSQWEWNCMTELVFHPLSAAYVDAVAEDPHCWP